MTAPVMSASVAHDYSGLLDAVRVSFAGRTGPLFTTDAEGLNELYLDSLPDERQVHNCHACRKFIEKYGGLVAILDGGLTVPVMWCSSDVPDFYLHTFMAMSAHVVRSRVTGVFLSSDATWGTPVTGPWSHMAVDVPKEMLYLGRALSAAQTMAVVKENFRTVAAALADFRPAAIDEAIRILEAGVLAESQRFIAPLRWLRELYDRPKGRVGENVLWLAVATAPEGYCHPRASVTGSLLEDIAAGLPYETIKSRFEAKVAPLEYQRPKAAPTEGNVKAAEALVAKLGLAPALERRFARLDEIKTVWQPGFVGRVNLPVETGGGVFAHLARKDAPGAVSRVDLPAMTMTWVKFMGTVMPTAEAMELHVPRAGSFIALTTAVHEDAPAILKWDNDETERNPVAWYVYPGGSTAKQWGLAATWTRVTAVAALPTMWGAHPQPYLGEGFVVVLAGAVDSNDNGGNGLFPACLKNELHAVRATIEAYSRSAKFGGRKEASACGYDMRKGQAKCEMRVLRDGAWSTYRIDRWD